MSRVLIIPAAGRGSRLGGALPKALVEVAGRPMLGHLFERYRAVADRILIVASPAGREAVAAFAGGRAEVQVQETPTGMLDAILVPLDRVRALDAAEVWVTWCDQVAVGEGTVAALAAAMADSPPPALAFPTWTSAEPYIHFDRDQSGGICGVRQRREGDDMPPRGEGDVGLFALRRDAYLDLLPRFAAGGSQGAGTGERNFLPFIPWLARRERVVTLPAMAAIEAVGINTPDDLARVAGHLTSRA